jgi:hypothetical protein
MKAPTLGDGVAGIRSGPLALQQSKAILIPFSCQDQGGFVTEGAFSPSKTICLRNRRMPQILCWS